MTDTLPQSNAEIIRDHAALIPEIEKSIALSNQLCDLVKEIDAERLSLQAQNTRLRNLLQRALQEQRYTWIDEAAAALNEPTPEKRELDGVLW